MKSLFKMYGWPIGFILFITAGYGQVSFISIGQAITSDKSWDIHLVDLNGDNNLDAYFEEKIWLNDGHGIFMNTGITLGPTTYVDFADLNGDHFIDAISNDIIYFNDKSFHFTDTRTLSSDISMVDVTLADVDNDDDVDIISGGANADRILLNDGQGNFTNTGKNLGGWGQCRYAVGDINGDGFNDIYVAIPHRPDPIYGHTPNIIWFGDGQGGYTSRNHDIPNAECRGVVLADFDGDHDLDLFVSDALSWGRVWFNDGIGNFTDGGQRIGSRCGPAKAADFNQDGFLDLFVTQGDGNGVMGNGAPSVVWLNDGTGHFTDSQLRLKIGNANSIAVDVGDINNDGRIDAVVAQVKLNDSTTPPSALSCPVEIWLNTTVTDVEENRGSASRYFQLFQNYPNPFNPSTFIRYSLNKPSQIRLSIFDLRGRNVKMLVDSQSSTGEHSLVWDGTDDSNNPVVSGVYLCTLNTNNNVSQRKMILMR